MRGGLRLSDSRCSDTDLAILGVLSDVNWLLVSDLGYASWVPVGFSVDSKGPLILASST